jgi:hypothetical protein
VRLGAERAPDEALGQQPVPDHYRHWARRDRGLRRAAGLDLDLLVAVLEASPMASDVSLVKAPKLVGRDFAAPPRSPTS